MCCARTGSSCCTTNTTRARWCCPAWRSGGTAPWPSPASASFSIAKTSNPCARPNSATSRSDCSSGAPLLDTTRQRQRHDTRVPRQLAHRRRVLLDLRRGTNKLYNQRVLGLNHQNTLNARLDVYVRGPPQRWAPLRVPIDLLDTTHTHTHTHTHDCRSPSKRCGDRKSVV